MPHCLDDGHATPSRGRQGAGPGRQDHLAGSPHFGNIGNGKSITAKVSKLLTYACVKKSNVLVHIQSLVTSGSRSGKSHEHNQAMWRTWTSSLLWDIERLWAHVCLKPRPPPKKKKRREREAVIVHVSCFSYASTSCVMWCDQNPWVFQEMLEATIF